MKRNVKKFDLANFLDPSAHTDDLVEYSNDLCLSTPDEVAPFKLRRKIPAVNLFPWINEDIHSFTWDCRKVERLWKSTKLQGHYLYSKDLLGIYNNMVKDVRDANFSNLISSSKSNPGVLFDTINRTVTPSSSTGLDFPSIDCDKFPSFFLDKVTNIRAIMVPSLP